MDYFWTVINFYFVYILIWFTGRANGPITTITSEYYNEPEHGLRTVAYLGV